MSKIVKIECDTVYFDTGERLYSDHDQCCCEHHYLEFDAIADQNWQGLDFDLSGDSFFERVEDFGIRLIPVNGHPLPVPGYGRNNGYYSSNLSLVLRDEEGRERTFDVSECQEID
jgi:hypothetical protein